MWLSAALVLEHRSVVDEPDNRVVLPCSRTPLSVFGFAINHIVMHSRSGFAASRTNTLDYRGAISRPECRCKV